MSRTALETVLVIDSDWRTLIATQEALEKAGYQVSTRDRVSGSVAAILRDKPGLLLVEPNMPIISGDTIVRIVATSDPRPDTMLLLHSSLPFHELQQKTVACGADGYVQKTDSAPRLLSQINHWLARARAGGSSSRHRVASPASEHDGELEPAESKARLLGPATKPRVLFVDDDPSMLKAYRRVMCDGEFDCSFTQYSEEAFALLQSDSPPDVVICDVLMPKLSGADLYARALETDPIWRKRFIFTTGFGTVSHISDFIDSVDARVFRKPIDGKALRDAIRYTSLNARIFAPRTRGTSSARHERP